MRCYNKVSFAHRGYFSKDCFIPENSMPAFHEAVKHGYGIELDVHLTKDQKLVVFHDDTLTRMCGLDKTIEQSTLAELRALHLQNTPEKIPLFSEVLHYVNGRVPLLIEIKLPTNDTSICHYVHEELRHYSGPLLIQSFNTLVLYWFRRHASHFLRGQLSSNLTKKKEKTSYILRFMVRFLLLNFYGKPDFISYKLKDTDNLSLGINQYLYKIPVAVWTLRNEKDYEYGKHNYNMTIFERFPNRGMGTKR